MRSYALAFTRGGSGHSITVCAGQPYSLADTISKIIDVPGCDYREFQSGIAFSHAVQKLQSRILEIITDTGLARPVRVVGHNLNLGKNPALSMAFAQCAGQCLINRKDVRFFSVVHDFAQEGRCDLMTRIRMLRKAGVEINGALFPVLPNTRFAAVAKKNARILRAAGLDVCYVPNPVIGPGRKPLLRAGRSVARKPVVFCPGRIISRKNPIEAVALAHVFFTAPIVLGEPGTSVADRCITGWLVKLCERHGVEAAFLDARNAAKKQQTSARGYAGLYEAADVCLTTSVVEGFGYSLYEPWLFNKAVIGRLPCGVESREVPCSFALYKRLLVPLDWVDHRALAKKYRRAMVLCYGAHANIANPEDFARQFARAFVTGQGIDFGCLDIDTQFAVLDAVCGSQSLAEEWRNAFPGQTAWLAAEWKRALRVSRREIAVRQKFIVARHGTQAFENSLERLLNGPFSAQSPVPAASEKIARYFCRVSRFRLLATPQIPGVKHSCAISA
jgi:glycosyltransferase involved in cell wall biosynthesis